MLINENNIEQIIKTIEQVHHTTCDQRLIDLTEYLNELFQSIQYDQSNLFRILKSFLRNYEDHAALKIEFLKGQCFEIIYEKLNGNENNLLSILEFIVELLDNSENVQDKFLNFNGYDKYFRKLCYIKTSTKDFMDQCISLTIDQSKLENSTDLVNLEFDRHCTFINPHMMKSIIYWLPYLTNASDQNYIISLISKILLCSSENRVVACSNGIILSLLEMLNDDNNSSKFDGNILNEILSLIENLSKFSINSKEVRHICQLFHRNHLLKEQLLKLIITAAKWNETDARTISSYFDLQRSNSGIVLSENIHWPSLSVHHLSFHFWLKLNNEIESYSYAGRRQIYSFYSDKFGLESFIRGSSLFVLVIDKTEIAYTQLNDCDDLTDGCWHSLTIVHTEQRSSLFVSAFQTALNCDLTIYIDGILRKQVKDFKYISFLSDSSYIASIGAPSQRPKSSSFNTKNESPTTLTLKTVRPWKSIFSTRSKSSIPRKDHQRTYSSNLILIEIESQETTFGPSICLHGLLACAWIFAETLNESQVQDLHNMGADFCQQDRSSMSHEENSISSIIFNYLSTRSVLAYHPLACYRQQCLDISGNLTRNNGRLKIGSCVRVSRFCQSLFNIGGCSILYPLIDLFKEVNSTYLDDSFRKNQNKQTKQYSLVDIRNKYYTNPIASIINLINVVLLFPLNMILTEHVTKQCNIGILGEYLNNISSNLIDEQLLVSIEQFIESSQLIDSSNNLTKQLIKYVLFNFNFWNRSNHSTRVLHLQYISSYITTNENFDKNSFDLEFFLDILKYNFTSTNDDDTNENMNKEKELRLILYEIMKRFIDNNVSQKDLNTFLSTISIISMTNDIITYELLIFLYELLQSSSNTLNEKLIEYLCESNMIEGLYSLLVGNDLSIETKEMVFKIMKYFIDSKQISDQVRTRLRLETDNVGFGGIISGLAVNQLNQFIIKEILNLIITSNSSASNNHMNIILTLCSATSVDVRCTAMREIINYFINHPSACRFYAECHGWQETLAHFFVKKRRPSISQYAPGRSLSHDGLLINTKHEELNLKEEILVRKQKNHSDSEFISNNPRKLIEEDSIENPDLSPADDIIDDSDSVKTNRSSASYSDITSLDLLGATKESICVLGQSKMKKPLIKSKSISANGDKFCQLIQAENLNNLRHKRFGRNHSDTTLGIYPVKIETIKENTENAVDYSRLTDDIFDENVVEEMCETLILVIVMILWKGITGSNDTAWIARGQIFSALRRVNREYDLYFPLYYIEQRILELSMEACLIDVKLDGAKYRNIRSYDRHLSFSGTHMQTPNYANNCRELIKLIYDFISQSKDNIERITDHFFYGIIAILDTTLVLKSNNSDVQSITTALPSDNPQSESSLIGLNILLTLLSHHSLSYFNQAYLRLHSLLNCRSFTGKEEAAYLLSYTNQLYLYATEIEDTKRSTCLLALMKLIFEKSFDLLQMNEENLNIPFSKASFVTVDDLQQYISSMDNDTWRQFIETISKPYVEHYESMSIKPFQMNMKIWWNNCHETMSDNIHKRNRQIETEKFKFQNYIVQPWIQRSRLDNQRTLKLRERQRYDRTKLNQQWQNHKKYLYGERGPWFHEKTVHERRWMLSDRENIHRMRCKLVENNSFNKHEEPSRLRDNLIVNKTDEKIDEKVPQLILKNDRKESLRRTSIDEYEIIDISNDIRLLLSEENEKILIGTNCSLITPTSVVHGEFILTEKFLYFFDLTTSKLGEKNFKYPLQFLQDIYLRRYNLRPTALEFFLINQRTFLLNFDQTISYSDKKVRRQVFQKIMSFKLPSMKNSLANSVSVITPHNIFKQSKLTEKWVARQISNFDYLIMLNTMAGRTYNDLNQYPIFPWLLKDFTSQVLDLNNPEVYRDLSKPIGIQNAKNINDVKLKYDSFEDATGLMRKFHYGTHYLNAASVMHYLIRMEPFTTLHIQLQSGKFDIADRQFHSLTSSWTNIMDSPNDGKEMIPEFFYLPEFLSNSNKFDLGKLQATNQILDDVELPPWANGSAEEFIHLHRLALESDYVSANLHRWIDLIFGYKQTGQAAVDAINVYMYYAYEEEIDLDAINDSITREAINGMIQNFGQMPIQLFTEPHPQRYTSEQAIYETELQGRPLSVFQNLRNLKAYYIDMRTANDKECCPIVFLSMPITQTRTFAQQGMSDVLITINENGVIGNNGWQPSEKTSNNNLIFERDVTLNAERNRLTTNTPFSPLINISSCLFTVSHDGKFIFSGGYWDSSLKIYSLNKSKIIGSITRHTDVITCLALDSTGYILVTGSRDTTCIIWNLLLNDNRHINNIIEQDASSLIASDMTLYGHTEEITCVAVSSELDLIVSGSLDGTCNMYTIEHGIYVRTLNMNTENNLPVFNIKLSDERHILIQTKSEETHLFLYSINGNLIRTRKFEYDVADMILCDQYAIIAVNHSSLSKTNSENTTSALVSAVIFKNLFQMTTVQTIRLRTQIYSLHLSKDSNHLFVSTKDGKLIVLIPEKKYTSRTTAKT